MKENFKIKPLTKAQIIISIDRLTRFKPTEDKYLRVFKDIITSNLIYPKFKKSELDLIDYEKLTNLVEKIFDFSLDALGISCSNNFSINEKLIKYEQSIFTFDKKVEALLNNKIDYLSLTNFIKDDHAPINLRWLSSLTEDANQNSNRDNHGLKFPIKKVVLVEGITEEILLPKFALTCGIDFNKIGIHLISAGGKNQVVKLFYQFADILKLPIFVLLDNDAQQSYEEIKPKLRKQDKVYIIKCGEFEDTLPITLIKRTLNRNFQDYPLVSLNDLRQNASMTYILEEIFKSCGQEFKKAEFASLINSNIESMKDVSEEIKAILAEL